MSFQSVLRTVKRQHHAWQVLSPFFSFLPWFCICGTCWLSQPPESLLAQHCTKQ